MFGHIRNIVDAFAGTARRRNISLFVLTIMGMIVGAFYTVAMDGWLGEEISTTSSSSQIASSPEDQIDDRQPQQEPTVFKSSGEDTINVNSSNTRDIIIEGD